MLRRQAPFLVALCAMVVLSAPASAVTPGPGWAVVSRAFPTNLPPGGKGAVQVNLYNVGAAPSSGMIQVIDTLPPGLTYTGAHSKLTFPKGNPSPWECAGTTVVTCTNEQPSVPVGAEERIEIEVNVAPAARGASPNRVTVTGGNAQGPASVSNQITISATPPSFGFAGFDGWFSNADGTLDTQAGSHPYELTVSLDLNNVEPAGPAGKVRNLNVNLPPGLVGDPHATARCTSQELEFESCPVTTQIGLARIGIGAGEGDPFSLYRPIYNMVAPSDHPAEFAFTIFGITTYIDAAVRSGGDYGITEQTYNSAEREIESAHITLWGEPADQSHDAQREGVGSEGEYCHQVADGGQGCPSTAARKPFLTLPTSCAGPQAFSVEADTWEDAKTTAEDSFLSHNASGTPTGFTGCDHLDFGPSLSVAPDTSEADTPAGLTAEVKVPQVERPNPDGLEPSNLRDTEVTLPAGVVINPGQAAGLVACQATEDGVGSGEAPGDEGPPSCPAASKVGTVAITTPLLPDKLEGNVYVLQSNPPNLQLLLAASADGVNLKLVGDVRLDLVTGQLTTTFARTPDFPFSDLKLSFSGGAQAALVTPTGCGTYTTTSDFTPWSSPFSVDALSEGSFAITSGPGGSPCASLLPFSPSLIAGATTDQAGGYTGFSLLLQRGDGQQRISSLQFRTPEGLLGMISKVPLCGEPLAAQGACSAASQIGHTVVAAGPGPYPLVVPGPGQSAAPIYLTGGYKGAPYGLSIAVPVIAGPFNLGTVVVRSKIEVDPHTAQLTVTTDPLPSILDGVPTDLRTINAVIDRSGFMFNPTDCTPMSFSGTAFSTEGLQAAISSHFQVGSCRSLTFKPDFKVSTAGKTSRAMGASLDARIVYPTGALGANQASSQSNIASVKVDLPRQLPSRLTTLQKACPVAIFDANPAGCPKESIVGHATAVTPVLPVGLSGPAYFVSHAGEAFPQLIVVLQGYGVTVDLVGDTFISKAGITSSTFKQVPDVPITSFELKLPQGKYSALAANGNLCKTKLTMPTAFTGHNGATIHQTTPITTTGCTKQKKTKGKALKTGHTTKGENRK